MRNEHLLDQLEHASTFVLQPRLALLWIAPALLGVVVHIATRNRNRQRRRQIDDGIWILVAVYLAAIVVLVTWPWDLQWSADSLRNGNWMPLSGSLGSMLSSDPIGNYLGERQVLTMVLLVAPIGMLVPIAFGVRNGFAVVLTIVAVGFAAEMLGAVSMRDRVFDLDDAIAAVTGGISAAAVTNVMHLAARLGRFAVR